MKLKRLVSILLTMLLMGSCIVQNSVAVSAESKIKLGDYVELGRYLDEPILWRCVAFDKISGYDESGNPIIDSMDTVNEYKEGYLPLMVSDRVICTKSFDANSEYDLEKGEYIVPFSSSHTRGGWGTYEDETKNEYNRYNRSSWGSNNWSDSNIRDWLNSSASSGNVVWTCGIAPKEGRVQQYGPYKCYYDDEAGFLTNFTSAEIPAIKQVTQKSLLDLFEYSDHDFFDEYYYNESDENGYRDYNRNILNGHIYNEDINDIVQNYATADSENCTDRMFLLDVKQVNTIYNNFGDYFKAKFTQKAIDNCIDKDSDYYKYDSDITADDYVDYWLRSPCNGSYPLSVDVSTDARMVYGDHRDSGVSESGNVGSFCVGCVSFGTYSQEGIRPAFYIDLENVNFNYGVGTEKDPYSVEDNTKVENIYADEPGLSFEPTVLDTVVDKDTSVKLISFVTELMSDEEKNSAKAKDELAYLVEEAAARSATLVQEDDIVINNEAVSQQLDEVSQSKSDIDSLISQKDLNVRKTRTKVRVATTKNDNVSVTKENITKSVDVVEAVTPFAALEFEPKSVTELSVENSGTNKIAVNFDKTDSTSKVTVKFPNIKEDDYKAIVDDEGNTLTSKYNPITNELSAKISDSGVFTVVNNEKSFNDIKNSPIEVQNAIKELASKGVIKGTSETEFSPDSPITRAEVAALIVRILDVDDPNADGGFTDVTRENWYFGTAGSSKQNNIIAGYEDNTFRGKVVIPKVQITSVTARVLKNELNYNDVPLSELDKFTDKDSIADWAKSDVALAANANMIIRRTDDSFAGESEMTRGDAAVVVKQLFDKVW